MEKGKNPDFIMGFALHTCFLLHPPVFLVYSRADDQTGILLKRSGLTSVGPTSA